MEIHFSFKIFMSFFEVALLIMERYFEVKLLSEYLNEGHYWWFGWTVFFLSMLGALIMFGVIAALITGEFDCMEFLKWGMFSLTFPISTLLW